jgi:hypothetical protein
MSVPRRRLHCRSRGVVRRARSHCTSAWAVRDHDHNLRSHTGTKGRPHLLAILEKEPHNFLRLRLPAVLLQKYSSMTTDESHVAGSDTSDVTSAMDDAICGRRAVSVSRVTNDILGGQSSEQHNARVFGA